MNIATQFINTVTLKNATNRVIQNVKHSKKPIIVTQHGQPAVAIVPIGESGLNLYYDKAYLKAIQSGLRDIHSKKTVNLATFVKKHLH